MVSSNTALVVVGHGSFGDVEASAPMRRAAMELAEDKRWSAVLVGFVKDEPPLADALRQARAEWRHVVVLPWFMADGYFMRRVLASVDEHCPGADVRSPIGTVPELGGFAWNELLQAGLAPRDGVLVVGHGTRRNHHSGRSTWDLVQGLQQQPVFDCNAAFLDQDPAIAPAAAQTRGERLFVLPMLAANGPHARIDIPTALGMDEDAHPSGELIARGTDTTGRAVFVLRALGAAAGMTELARTLLAGALTGQR